MKIILFGKNGQLAQQFINDFKNFYDLIVIGSNEVNFKDSKKLKNVIEMHKPDLVINAAAYTQVDLAENNKKDVFRINSEALSTIANSCKKNCSKLIHFSSDYVFDGKKNQPYLETDKPNPINIYGKSKFEGEKNIINSNCNFFIFRIAWLMSVYNNNFIKFIVTKLKNGENLKIINDQIGTPTTTKLIVETTKKVLISKKILPKKIFHIAPNGSVSWYHFAIYISKKLEEKKLIINQSMIEPITSFEYGSIAERPKYSVLNNKKIEKAINVTMPCWKKSIDELIEYHAKNN